MRDRRATWAIIVLGILACARVPASPPVTAPASIPAVDSVQKRITPITRLASDSARYSVTAITHATELSERRRSDSTLRETSIVASLTSSTSNSWLLQLSGNRVISDSLFSARSRRASNDSLERLALRIDTIGAHLSLDAGSLVLCNGNAALLSPLLARLFIVPSRLGEEGDHTLRDSLTYISCAGTAVLTTVLEVQFGQLDSAGVAVRIAGITHADSTKALPMHLHGTLSGKAHILPATSSTLPDQIDLNLDLELSAKSALRQQQLKQNTKVTVKRR